MSNKPRSHCSQNFLTNAVKVLCKTFCILARDNCPSLSSWRLRRPSDMTISQVKISWSLTLASNHPQMVRASQIQSLLRLCMMQMASQPTAWKPGNEKWMRWQFLNLSWHHSAAKGQTRQPGGHMLWQVCDDTQQYKRSWPWHLDKIKFRRWCVRIGKCQTLISCLPCGSPDKCRWMM